MYQNLRQFNEYFLRLESYIDHAYVVSSLIKYFYHESDIIIRRDLSESVDLEGYQRPIIENVKVYRQAFINYDIYTIKKKSFF